MTDGLNTMRWFQVETKLQRKDMATSGIQTRQVEIPPGGIHGNMNIIYKWWTFHCASTFDYWRVTTNSCLYLIRGWMTSLRTFFLQGLFCCHDVNPNHSKSTLPYSETHPIFVFPHLPGEVDFDIFQAGCNSFTPSLLHSSDIYIYMPCVSIYICMYLLFICVYI